jgi:hypothetical protein
MGVDQQHWENKLKRNVFLMRQMRQGKLKT